MKEVNETKCYEIIKMLSEYCYILGKGKYITFEQDWDKNTLTVYTDEAHYHIGVIGNVDEDKSINRLVDDLYSLFKQKLASIIMESENGN